MPRSNNRNSCSDNRVEAIGVAVADGSKTTIYISIEGQPLAQPRPRFRVLSNGRSWMYNPAMHPKTELAQKVRAALREIGLSVESAPLFTTYLGLTIKFGVSDMSKDLDNMMKFIMDVLEDANVYGNDRAVLKLHAEKLMSRSGFTEVEISPISGYTEDLSVTSAILFRRPRSDI